MSKAGSQPPHQRSTYRHGDLRRALLDMGFEMARRGGPDAVVLREATRRAGVAPNAAYRHFQNQADLLAAVRSASLSALATAIEVELNKLPALKGSKPSAVQARRSLSAVGRGYLQFALHEPGLFRTAFSVPAPIYDPPDPANAGASGLNPFQLLSLALDRMAAAGVLPAGKRRGAEFLAWSAVHGLALLILDGPLRGVDTATVQQFSRRLLTMVERGLS